MICMIDNYDSFVYNLVQYLSELGEEIAVFRNDKISVQQIRELNPRAVVLSPGPGFPVDAGICMELICKLKGIIPIFGVCLGHQSIAEAFGAKIKKSNHVVHGKTSKIYHDNRSIFKEVENPFQGTRYHSLIVERATLPSCLEVSAWTEDGTIMGIRHREHLIEGVQFHPESVLTDEGKAILRNFFGALDH